MTDFAKGIILVGGLGSSSYLHELLKERYSRENIDVFRPAGIRPLVSAFVAAQESS